ncbi:MAG: hypothetical protein ABWW69_06945 [Pyrodictiaceae archaeon]
MLRDSILFKAFLKYNMLLIPLFVSAIVLILASNGKGPLLMIGVILAVLSPYIAYLLFLRLIRRNSRLLQ